MSRPERYRYRAPAWGTGELLVDARGRLVAHELAGRGLPDGDDGHPLGTRFAEYLAGSDDDFADVVLDLDGATPFQRAVVAQLRRVPRGETVTYGELAALAGHPRAGRAAGSVCATGGFSLVVPYHRVVAAHGLGGYGPSGAAVKARLLRLEGVDVAAL